MSYQEQISELDTLLKVAKIDSIRGFLLKYKNDIQSKLDAENIPEGVAPSAAAAVAPAVLSPPKPPTIPTATAGTTTFTNTTNNTSLYYIPIDGFSWDQGDYNSKIVSIYIDLHGVGALDKSLTHCDFTRDSFTLTVRGLNGKNYK